MLLALIKKEWLLLSRDIHGLLLLFIMPLIFIIIMSLALKDAYSSHDGVRIHVQVMDRANTPDSRALLEVLGKNSAFIFESNAGHPPFVLAINSAATAPMVLPVQNASTLALSVVIEPDTKQYVVTLFLSLLREAQVTIQMEKIKKHLEQNNADPVLAGLFSAIAAMPEPNVVYQYQGGKGEKVKTPNSTQQNVPAWLVFAMFFVVVPLSNALLSEEQSGTLRRMKTFNVSPAKILLGKLIPYFFINQVQVVLMLCAGIWLMPLLGGDRLVLGDHFFALALLSMSISVLALGYALFIATLAKTTEQATTLGGIGNILLAAIGGVMVPVFVMPEFMQRAAEFSPMYWAVQGFLDVMLRGGGVEAILFESGLLSGLGLVLLAVAAIILNRRV